MSKERSFRARWAESLGKYGFTEVSNVFLDRYSALDITTGEAIFIIHCFRYKWGVEEPFPSLKTIALLMGVSRGTVQGYARSLESKKYLVRKLRKNQTTKYDFGPLIRILERIAPYRDIDVEGIKSVTKVYAKTDTKEDPLKRHKEELIKKFTL